MHWIFATLLMAAGIGPMGPDAPAREPQLAVNGSTAALVFGAGNGIYFSASSDAGKTFSAPVKVFRSRGSQAALARGKKGRGRRARRSCFDGGGRCEC